MAVDDLDSLRSELPDLFLDIDVPPSWEENWIFTKIDQPESTTLSIETEVPSEDVEDWLEPPDSGTLSDAPSVDSPTVIDFGNLTNPPDFGSSGYFPGAPKSHDIRNFIPPPDCLGFYLPFHYFHPTWWGVYLILEGVQGLANFIYRYTTGILTFNECVIVTRLFIYGHEAFHHIVESFATRLEISHRKPLYRIGFHRLYREHFDTDNSFEEVLASAHGYRKVNEKAFRQPNEPTKRQAGLEALAEYIRLCPPGYNRALEFIKDTSFISTRSEFAEHNHNWSLPDIGKRSSGIWGSFPHAFSGISRVHSRVNYAIHRDSPLSDRIRTRGHFLRYRDVVERLEKLGSCTFIRYGGGGHEIWRNPMGQMFPVPRHPRDLATGTLRKIIKQAGIDISVSQFISLKV